MPKLSVIIPVHNEYGSVKQCLDSITSQSFRDIEILCIDDGSTDGSTEILTNCANLDKRIHVLIFKRRLGTVLARKLALLDAHGEYIMFADADDRLLPGACETAVKLMMESGSDIAQFSVDVEAEK